jgi:tetratricopeptide (TPR) repeat protein
MVDAQTSHANGAYTEEEKNNRSIFLERLGAVYLEENKTDLAIAAYQKMIDMGGSIAVRGYQGASGRVSRCAQVRQGDRSGRKAVAADPKDRDLKLMLAGELADQGHPDEGLAMAKSLLDGATPDEQRGSLVCDRADGRAPAPLEGCRGRARQGEPLATKKEDRTYLFFLRGELAERQKHLDQAEQYFRQALNLDPANAMTLNYLGYMWADKGEKLPEALKMIRQGVDIEPMNGAYLDSLGWVYFKMGEYELAEDNLRQAVNRDQTDPTVHMHLGDLYEKTGRIRLAAAQWQLSLDEFAKSSPADIEPGDVAKVQKKLEGARVRLAKEDSPSLMPCSVSGFTSQATNSRLVSPVRLIASATNLPDAESRHTKASIFLAPVWASSTWVRSNATLAFPLMSITSTMLMPGCIAKASLNPFNRSSVLGWLASVKKTTLPFPPSFSIILRPPKRPASRLLVPMK